MNRKTILIVEGGKDNRLVLENGLAVEEYSVISAHNGRDAISIAKARNPDLIVIGRILEDMSGEEVADKLRGYSKTSSIPIIFLGESFSEEDKVRKEAVFSEGSISTPYDMGKLRALIERLLCVLPTKNRTKENSENRSVNKNTSVLVVDDEADIRRVLKYNLELDGFDVYSAIDGPTGLRIASEKMPDVILLDWVMPKMDGLEVLAELRDNERTRGIIVFMLTAKSMMDDVALALANGADDYIPKPIEGAELGQRIKSMLEVFRRQNGGKACEGERMTCLQSSEKD